MEHVCLLSGNVHEGTEVAQKAIRSSAAQHAASRIKIVKRVLAFVPNSRVCLALVRFFEVTMARATSA